MGVSGFAVRRFVEKPTREKASEYLAAGRYYWNSGMFCFQVGAFLEELLRHAPQVYRAVETCWQATARAKVPVILDQASFAELPPPVLIMEDSR